MSTNREPFRSRPRVERRTAESTPNEPLEPMGEDEEIIEGVLEETAPEPSVLPAAPRVHDPIRLPDEYVGEMARAPQKRTGLLLVALGLIFGGIFLTILQNANLPDAIEAWYPLLSLAVAVLWALRALARRDMRSFLAGAVVAGFSISLLLEAQQIAQFHETVIGMMLMTFGLAIVMRGLLVRPALR